MARSGPLGFAGTGGILLLDPDGEEHAVYMTGLGTIVLLVVPFIPGQRDIPRLIPVYRLVWRSWYRCDPGLASIS
jgi:hypothetical protein